MFWSIFNGRRTVFSFVPLYIQKNAVSHPSHLLASLNETDSHSFWWLAEEPFADLSPFSFGMWCSRQEMLPHYTQNPSLDVVVAGDYLAPRTNVLLPTSVLLSNFLQGPLHYFCWYGLSIWFWAFHEVFRHY